MYCILSNEKEGQETKKKKIECQTNGLIIQRRRRGMRDRLLKKKMIETGEREKKGERTQYE